MFISLWMIATIIYVLICAGIVKEFIHDDDMPFNGLAMVGSLLVMTLLYSFYWIGQLVYWYNIR